MNIKHYWQSLTNSFTNRKYYLEIPKLSFWSNLKFFLASFVILSFLSFLSFKLMVLPQVTTWLKSAGEELVANYPTDLVINWDGQQLAINQDKKDQLILINQPSKPFPLNISLRNQLLVAISSSQITSPQDTVKQLAAAPIFLIDPTQLYFQSQNQWEARPINTVLFDIPAFTINKSNIQHAVDLRLGDWQTLTHQDLIIGVLIWLIVTVSSLVMTSIYTTLIYLFIRITGQKISFLAIFKISLHIIVVAETINTLTTWLYQDLPLDMTSLAFWLMWIVAGSQVYRQKNDKASG